MQRKSDRTLNFTKPAVEGLIAPLAGREYHYDEKLPGLAVCVTAAGTIADARRGRNNVAAASRGGKAKAKEHSLTPDQCKAAANDVADLMDKEGYSRTLACREVAERYFVDDKPVSYKTIERAFKAEAAAKK